MSLTPLEFIKDVAPHNQVFFKNARQVWKAQREKCPNAEFFLVRIFLFSDWIPRFTQFQIFKPLIYCFEETIRFDVKASFGSRLALPLIR